MTQTKIRGCKATFQQDVLTSFLRRIIILHIIILLSFRYGKFNIVVPNHRFWFSLYVRVGTIQAGPRR